MIEETPDYVKRNTIHLLEKNLTAINRIRQSLLYRMGSLGDRYYAGLALSSLADAETYLAKIIVDLERLK